MHLSKPNNQRFSSSATKDKNRVKTEHQGKIKRGFKGVSCNAGTVVVSNRFDSLGSSATCDYDT